MIGPTFHRMSDYYANPAISHSMLKNMAKSPAHFKAALEAPGISTDALTLGSLVHAMVLEPHTVEHDYIKVAKIDRRTKEGKQLWADLQDSEKRAVQEDVWATAENMAESVMSCSAAKSLILEATAMNSVEVEFYWRDTRFDLDRKSKVDGITETSIVDLKTTTDATRGFDRSIMKYWYHTQAAYYRDALKSKGLHRDFFTIIAVEKAPPYAVAVVRLDSETMDWAKKIVDGWLDQLRWCQSSRNYPAFTGVRYFKKPAWAEDDND